MHQIKPLHYSDGRLQCADRENNKPNGKGNVLIWARIEKEKRRHLGRMCNTKKVKKYPKESIEKNDYEQHQNGRRNG